ncbi:P-loop containing nucleoside triphosphate hydrolase protein [Ceraceosorus guamensis]|uniref:P-loop containing nucleoside triphosphate hydrolase protein n=1 Tax=Ceraceosorus guamensis TaxID=1522189 RepID=A0A316W7X5_9BASI|nr:P-loop containing nucleoside triphosphate hydrolase protein [Ceraceosorus guamensis]PWN45997.1 P-loop containing nucleoside triphosphate hydrolase protein [Ceraceosorus guamensis]
MAAMKGSIRLMYATLPVRYAPLTVVAVVLSICSGAIQPLMTRIIGDAFDAFAKFNPTSMPNDQIPQERRDALMSSVATSIWRLCALGVGTMILSTSMISAWIALGERVASGLRLKVYTACDQKRLDWYDCDMGTKSTGQEHSEDGTGIGAGGLMARFAREIDDVRVASSQTFGQLLQYVVTTIACVVLALAMRWDLTLVVLASVPLTAVIAIACEVIAASSLAEERTLSAKASGNVERVVNAIATVKAFNAEVRELRNFQRFLAKLQRVNLKITTVWAVRTGATSGIALAMFSSGFAYGSHLVQKGACSPGTVMTVFWSALLATSHLQQVIDTLNIIEKGKVASASLHALCAEDGPVKKLGHQQAPSVSSLQTSPNFVSSPAYDEFSFIGTKPAAGPRHPLSPRLTSPRTAVQMKFQEIPQASRPSSPVQSMHSEYGSESKLTMLPARSRGRGKHLRPRKVGPVAAMRRIRPERCYGEITLTNVGFAYPSRPDVAVLKGVSMYFAAGETTYVVGASGSGKSTIAQLLMRQYEIEDGSIQLDDQDITYLDADWVRSKMASVDQTPIVFDLSVHENVALGLCGVLSESNEQVSGVSNHVPAVPREDVIAACRTALLHEFIMSLPDGYDTQLGARGASLSGGQKQRLSIARAKLRDPSILMLDEATSALDPKSRLLVNEAVKAWRRGRTTIIITHDLSSLGDEDFVYLMHDGQIAEHGFCGDLRTRAGPFCELAEKQSLISPTGLDQRASLALESLKVGPDHSRAAMWGQRLSMLVLPPNAVARDTRQWSRTVTTSTGAESVTLGQDTNKHDALHGLRPLQLAQQQQHRTFEEDIEVVECLQAAGEYVSARRPLRMSDASQDESMFRRRRWDPEELSIAASEKSHFYSKDDAVTANARDTAVDLSGASEVPEVAPASIREVVKSAWHHQPYKVLLIFGLTTCVAAGVVPPIFSFVLGKLLATMGKVDQGSEVIKFALIVLGLAFVDFLFRFLSFFTMEFSADLWVRQLRELGFRQMVAQDKAWFDQPVAAAGVIVTQLVKDADDAQAFISRIAGHLVLIAAMVLLAFVWALAVGWQLTLVGVALAPVFIVAVALQSRVVTKHEVRNKTKREAVAKRFYDMVANVKGIRSMALEPVFRANFVDAVKEAEQCALRAAPVSGFGFGLAEALTYLSEALMYFVSAVLVSRGIYDLERMMIVFNLIIFAVTFAGQSMAWLPGLSKSVQAAGDLKRLVDLPGTSSETSGRSMPHVQGTLVFDNVFFSYPLRPDVPVLQGITLNIRQGERVALVGDSGCGKSTVAALLQRLYEPKGGRVLLDDRPISDIDTRYLREHLAVVSQHPNLFDATVSENIAYGASGGTPTSVTQSGLERAARRAHADTFIRALPSGYETALGENAGRVSGGQAQRLAIARALVRQRARVLILDECTSALDPVSQEAVANALLGERGSPQDACNTLTTLVVTHKVQMMQRCDRIIVLEGGRVVEQGPYEELIRRRGPFATLASGGKWDA